MVSPVIVGTVESRLSRRRRGDYYYHGYLVLIGLLLTMAMLTNAFFYLLWHCSYDGSTY